MCEYCNMVYENGRRVHHPQCPNRAEVPVCDCCGDVFQPEELEHGMCHECRVATIDRLRDMVRSQFGEAERTVINEWNDVEAIGF